MWKKYSLSAKKHGWFFGWVWFKIEIWIYTRIGSGKKVVVGVLVTKFFQEIKNKWIGTRTETVCLMYDRLKPGTGEAKGQAQTGGHTLSYHWKPLHPSALVRWPFGVPPTAPGLHRVKKTQQTKKTTTRSNHLLTQISYTQIMRLITPVPSTKQITLTSKPPQP